MKASGSRPDDRGSISVELAILLPAFTLMIILALLFGRQFAGQGSVDLAAHDAARAASLSRNETQAKAAALAAAEATLKAEGTVCMSMSIDYAHSNFAGFSVPVGQPANVTVAVTCTVKLTDLGFTHDRTLWATFTSPIDQYRGRS